MATRGGGPRDETYRYVTLEPGDWTALDAAIAQMAQRGDERPEVLRPAHCWRPSPQLMVVRGEARTEAERHAALQVVHLAAQEDVPLRDALRMWATGTR